MTGAEAAFFAAHLAFMSADSFARPSGVRGACFFGLGAEAAFLGAAVVFLGALAALTGAADFAFGFPGFDLAACFSFAVSLESFRVSF